MLSIVLHLIIDLMTEKIVIRVSKEWKQSLLKAAGNKTLSDYIRSVLQRHESVIQKVLHNEENVIQPIDKDQFIKNLVIQNQKGLPIDVLQDEEREDVIHCTNINRLKFKR